MTIMFDCIISARAGAMAIFEATGRFVSVSKLKRWMEPSRWPLRIELPGGEPSFGRRYLSNATCLMRPCLFYACFVVSRITIICYTIRHF